MASDHTIVVDGTDLRDAGALLSKFAETLPEPKVVKVSIPAGLDLDITDSLGAIGYHNGKHTLTLYVNAETEAERMRLTRGLVSLMHGNMLDYRLSWDEGYIYRGRFAVKLERLSPRSSRVTLDIDRNPWKRMTAIETVDVICHPTGTVELDGSKRFHTVKAKGLQDFETSINGGTAQSWAAGTRTLAADLYDGDEIAITVGDWLMYVDEGGDLVVNEDYYSLSGSAVTVDSSYEVTDGDIAFAAEVAQHATVSYYRWDL